MGPFDILAEQHRELEERFGALEMDGGADEPDEQHEHADELIALLRMHMHLEERHVYPLLARVEGRARAREETEDHLTMRELMDELDEQPPGGPEWWARLLALEDLVVAHVREEEEQTFARLATALDQGEQEELRHALETLRDELSSHERSWMQNPALLNEPRWDV
jgi:hemerythrin-like domain-containing protein